jgi:CheY-like chemotaxis protein
VEQPAPPHAPALNSLLVPSGRSETVLLVEDEPMVRRLSREILEMHGYHVLEAMQGDEALRICEQHEGPIHVLLTDVVMPRMSGRELAERVRVLRPDTRILFMSGYTDDAVVRHGIFDEDIPFLQKPFTADVLALKVRAVLGQEEPGPAATAGARRLLVVEDDADTRASLVDLLDEEGYDVYTARDGADALEWLRENDPPQVILLDLMMPRMNGWIFRLEQQKDPVLAAIPVVLMSGIHDPEPAAGFLRAAGHLRKPLDVPALLRLLEQYCPAPGRRGAAEV